MAVDFDMEKKKYNFPIIFVAFFTLWKQKKNCQGFFFIVRFEHTNVE